jgi:hypothetical protein
MGIRSPQKFGGTMMQPTHPKIIPNDKLTTHNLDSKTHATMRELRGELTELNARIAKEIEELSIKVVKHDAILTTLGEVLGK